ncbi:MAG TPA: SRPBCC family protein [Acidisarcina sp.]
MEESVIEAVRKEVVINTAQSRAFDLFTGDIGRWWPASHHIGRNPYETAIIEPAAGGRWYEVATNGAQCNWGTVLAWEPPARVLLSWNIGLDWQFNPDMTRASEVEVRFTALGDSQTRVELVHRHFDRHGEGWQTMRDNTDTAGGWLRVLEDFKAHVESDAHANHSGAGEALRESAG